LGLAIKAPFIFKIVVDRNRLMQYIVLVMKKKIKKIKKNLKWYTFRQNNSGGSFRVDVYVSIYVFIQATSEAEANKFAETVGLYFDGMESGWDCECCGDRWSRADATDGYDKPTKYGEVVDPDVKNDEYRFYSYSYFA
jgi:hypothetical protein